MAENLPKKCSQMYEYYLNLWTETFKNIPKVIPSDEICIELAKRKIFNNCCEFKWYKPQYDIGDALARGYRLLASKSRYKNKPIVAEIKANNTKIKTRNRQLQRISREYFRRTNPDLEYDINRWDKVPRRIYEEAANQYSLETMDNPIIKWVLEK